MKYIQIRHMDYWFSYYNLANFKQDDINFVEFSILNTKNSISDTYFSFDFYNLNSLEEMIKNDEYLEKTDKDYNKFISNYNDLKNNKKDYFIGSLFYPHYTTTIEECELKGKSLFEKSLKFVKPNYGHIFLNERENLLPQKIIYWIEKLSYELFKENIKFKINNICKKSEAQKYIDKYYMK